MVITTKTGDKGKTSLCRGKRVAKDSLRIEICGILDELNSYLGISKSLTKDIKLKQIVESIQKDLFIIGAEVATEARHRKQLKVRIDNKFIERLEELIEQLEESSICSSFCFCLPGANPVSSSLDVSRALARKLERRIVTLKRKKFINNDFVLIYLNRLSDLLFLFARKTTKKFSKKK
ncbi:MAG: cob(I)yrinic acid a,c-diamide adenosyltransferase [Candidatus Omnitrophica bacterium]|nr:cob(I)yrinic acid a,c-diamide adenosyltransferase [Candidatus Omnitrophota bacterium]